MTDLKDRVAEKLGVSTSELMASITSHINSIQTMLYISSIFFIVTTFVFIAFWWIVTEGDESLSDRSKIYRIYFWVAGIMGLVLLLYAISRTVAYDTLVFNRLLEIAKIAGVI